MVVEDIQIDYEGWVINVMAQVDDNLQVTQVWCNWAIRPGETEPEYDSFDDLTEEPEIRSQVQDEVDARRDTFIRL